MMMGSSGMVRSAVFNWDALPAWGHDWERFTVVYAGTPRGPEQYPGFVLVISCDFLVQSTIQGRFVHLF